MKTSKDEQIKKHSRLINSIRSICLTLCITLIIGISPIYAYPGVVVENVVDVETPGTLWSYITNSDGTIDVSSSDSLPTGSYKFTWYLGRLSQTISRIGHFTYQNGSYLATLYTYLSNNLPGQWQTLTDIKTATTNSAVANQALLQLVGDQVNIDWKDSSAQYVGVYDPNGNLLQNNTTYSFSDYYIAFTGFHNDRDSITKINIPLSAWSSNPYVKSVSVYSGIATGKVSELYYFVETSASTGINVYFTPAMPYSAVYIRVTVNGNFHTITPNLSYIQYLPNTSEDYFKIYDFIIQYNLLQKDTNIEVTVNDSINSTDIDLDVEIGIGDFTAVNTVSNKLRTWLTTGVSVSALIGALDDLDDSFFTLSNRNTIETINNQYTDFYD